MKGLFSVIFGVSESFLPIIVMLLFRGRHPALLIHVSGMKKEYYRKLHGIFARLMGLLYILVSLLCMPFFDGKSVAWLLYLIGQPPLRGPV